MLSRKSNPRLLLLCAHASGQALAYVYFKDEAGGRTAAKLLSYDEARRLLVNIAKAVWQDQLH